jgi:hypothetical protein
MWRRPWTRRWTSRARHKTASACEMAGRDSAGARWNGFGEFSTRWISATDRGRPAQSIDDPPPGVTLESGQHTNQQIKSHSPYGRHMLTDKTTAKAPATFPAAVAAGSPLRKKLFPLERPSPHPNQQRQPLRRTASFLATAGPGTSASRTPRLVPRLRRARDYFVLPWRENPGLMLPEFAPST